MPSFAALLAFSIPVAMAMVIPGTAVLYIIANGLRQGRAAGLVCVAGLASGTSIHVILATLGLSAILASSTTLFMAIKFAGAAYLIWLGASTLFRHDAPPCVVVGAPKMSWQTLYTRGVAIQFTNPGIVLFIVALLPQFVDPESGSATLQILVLGITFIAIELIVESAYALGSSAAAKWLGRHPNANLQCGRLTGAIYLAFGVLLGISTVAAA